MNSSLIDFQIKDYNEIIFEVPTDAPWLVCINTHVYAKKTRKLGLFRDKIYLEASFFGHHGQAAHMSLTTKQELLVSLDNLPLRSL